jgi:hypothetical protein
MLTVIKKANDIAFLSQYYATAQGRENDDQLKNYFKKHFKYKNDRFISYCAKKFGYGEMTYSQLDKKFCSSDYRYPLTRQVPMCKSCHAGTSTTKEDEITEQTKKYGKFICRSCEKNALEIGKGETGRYLIFEDGIFEDEGSKKPGSSFLGFAGRWFLIKKKDRVWITNNLFVRNTLSEELKPLFAKNINAVCYCFYKIDEIKKYVTNEEYRSILESNAYKYYSGVW